MTKEQKGTVTAEDMETTAETTETTQTLQLFIERKPAKDKLGKPIKTKTGEPIYNYQLPAVMRGRTTYIDFSTADKGGFEPLDNVYYGTDRAELFITTQETEYNGRKTVRTIYEVKTIDEDGVEWACEIRPARKSDADLLRQYLAVLAAKKAG